MEDVNKTKSGGSGKKRIIFIVMAAGTMLVLVLFGLSLVQIYSSVKTRCDNARHEFGGDSVEALMALIESDARSFKERNSAIWALGQLGDRRAVPFLQNLITDEDQPPPYDSSRYIVQYSVKKALKSCRGKEPHLTKWMYRDLRESEFIEN
jgi:hypothetical protein